MKERGQSATGEAVYSEDDPADFLWHWLRVSWSTVLCGRTFDGTGETPMQWLCAVEGTDEPPSMTVSKGLLGKLTLQGDWRLKVLMHPEIEDSRLNPDQPFRTSHDELTFVVEATLTQREGMYEVKAFRIRRTTREMEPMALRYGGHMDFHIWVP